MNGYINYRNYIKKTVAVGAIQFTEENGQEIANWCGGRYIEEPKASDPTDVFRYIEIPTLEGTMLAKIGDFILRGVRGEFYPCAEDIFVETYDEAESLVEIGGQVMTQSQFDAARFPLLNPRPLLAD